MRNGESDAYTTCPAFRDELNAARRPACPSPRVARYSLAAGGWTRKQIVGHLLDSAANNRQRFVRAAIQGKYTGPEYEQDAWVAAHGYGDVPWETLVRWWQAEHEILMAVAA